MARFLVLYRANPAVWPTDPGQALAILEGVLAGGDHLLASGALQEVGWFTPQAGYALFEAESKAQVLGLVHPFFPYFSQEMHEIVPWEEGKHALLGSARQAAAR